MVTEQRPIPLEYGEPPKPAMKLGKLLLLVGLVAFAGSLLLPSLNRGPPASPQVRCQSNLRQIGQGMYLYAQDYGGVFPDSFAAIIAAEQISPEVFVCRLAAEQTATGANPRAVLQDFAKIGRCSYVYVGTGLGPASDPNAIVAFEDPANHGFEGACVLYADGHVDWLVLSELMETLSGLAAGVNPPKPPGVLRTADAKKLYETQWRGRMPLLKLKGLQVMPATQEGVTNRPDRTRD